MYCLKLLPRHNKMLSPTISTHWSLVSDQLYGSGFITSLPTRIATQSNARTVTRRLSASTIGTGCTSYIQRVAGTFEKKPIAHCTYSPVHIFVSIHIARQARAFSPASALVNNITFIDCRFSNSSFVLTSCETFIIKCLLP